MGGKSKTTSKTDESATTQTQTAQQNQNTDFGFTDATQTNSTRNTSGTQLSAQFQDLMNGILGQAKTIQSGGLGDQIKAANATNVSMLGDTLSGKYLDPANNPTLKGYVDAAINPLRDSLKATSLNIGDAAQLAGAYGGGRQQVLSDQALRDFNTSATDAANKVYYNDYAQERANQLGAGALLAGAQGIDTGALDSTTKLAALINSFAPYNATSFDTTDSLQNISGTQGGISQGSSTGQSSGTSSSTSNTVGTQKRSLIENITMLASAMSNAASAAAKAGAGAG